MKDLQPPQCQAILTKKQAAVVRHGIKITPAKVIKTRCTQYARDHGLCNVHAKMQREGKLIERLPDE
ncbi:hypothetical protein HCU64_22820 [Methylobacterium sp. C25]|uniref:hypothetical protein n=1 Tax=Methylobacterium sp. C25 TaxID=2721622 RepID=UPI001F414445|nr:hypothetical protein [Methylobacterium sp. C25]MCE4226580.1 hypothetical protein [Methylobacterium sp. C25]